MAREFLTPPDFKAGLLLNGSAGTAGQQITSQGPGQPPAWGAPGGGGLPSPGLAPWSGGSGSMLAPNNCRTGALTNVSAQLNFVEYHQIFIPEAVPATQLICRTHTTYAGTTDVLLGIYNNSGSRPTTKIVDAALQITASGAATYAAAINQSVSPGWYWLAFLATAGGATPSFVANLANVAPAGEFTSAGAIVTVLRQAGQTSLPATAGSLQVSNVSRPVCFLGV